ncbi:MAG: SGNH/GDSL hydrolase family protein [Bacteroidota bacterium]|nr:SGNH/GDSL hydrolase family protein [Bacteroidota bacterium]
MLILTCGAVLYGQTADSGTEKQAFHWLALGDSYTIGASVKAAERFPAQTARHIQNRFQKETDIDYMAATGWTSEDLQDALANSDLKQHYDWVTLLIGVNDQYQGLDTGGYRTRFTQLLKTALRLVQGNKERVCVMSIPDYSATPFGRGSGSIHREIANFNRINYDIACQYQVGYCDITGISQTAAGNPSLTAMDHLHPSGKQYQLWAMKLFERMSRLFQ